MVSHHDAADDPTPAVRPSWPRFRLGADEQACQVRGWHLTPTAVRLARFLGRWLAVCGLAFVGWYCWGFQHIPALLERAAVEAAMRFQHWQWQFDRRAWFLSLLYAAAWLLLPVWRRLLAAALAPLFLRPTTVRFSARAIELRPSVFRRQHVPRRPIEPPVFVLLPEPGLEWRQAKIRPPAVAAFDGQTQHLAVQAERLVLPVARFAYAGDAARFHQACQFALAYPLIVPPPPRPAGGRQTGGADV